MIKRINFSQQDKEGIMLTKVDPATQVNDFFDYSKLVVKKPWGYEYLAFQNQQVAVWILFIKKGFQTSLHCHPNKKTALVMLSGKALFRTMNTEKKVSAAEGFMIEKGVFHSTESLTEEGIYVMEIETPINKRDLLRLRDLYGRENQGYEGKESMRYNLNNYNYFTFEGPSVYYDNKKKFGKSSIRIIRFDNNAAFQAEFDYETADLITVLKGRIMNKQGKILAETGDTLDLKEVRNKKNMAISGNLELLLTKKNDNSVRLSDFVASFLSSHGVSQTFMVGGQLNTHLMDAIGKNNRIRYIFTHHEQAAAMAALAYSKVTKKLGVCIVSSGASATNAITGVAGAWIDSVPMIIISGQAKLGETKGELGVRQLGIDEINIVDLVKPITKYALMIKKPKEIRYHLEKAYTLATQGRPGPVWLDIPLDVQVADVDEARLSGIKESEINEMKEIKTNKKELEKLKEKVTRVVKLLSSSKRPVLLAGNGVHMAGAENEFLALINNLNIPVVTSRNGRDLITYDHHLLVGGIGAYGDRAANFAIQNSDLLISIGARLSPSETGCSYDLFAREAKKVVVDIDFSEATKPTIKADLPVVADAKAFIDELNSQLSKSKYSNKKKSKPSALTWWINKCEEWKKRYPRLNKGYNKQEDFVNVYYFIHRLSELAQENDVLVLGRGTAFYTSIQAFRIKKGQRMISSAGLSSFGFGLPGAIGASIANPDHDVICICGDGGIQINIQELATIAYNKFPIKIFVLDNQGHSTIRKTQRAYFKSKFIGTDLDTGKGFVEMNRVMQAYGFKTFTLRNDFEIDKNLKKVFSTKDAFVCFLKISKDQYPEPRLVSSITHEGVLISRPLEDLYPFLDRKELKKNLFIRPVDFYEE